MKDCLTQHPAQSHLFKVTCTNNFACILVSFPCVCICVNIHIHTFSLYFVKSNNQYFNLCVFLSFLSTSSILSLVESRFNFWQLLNPSEIYFCVWHAIGINFPFSQIITSFEYGHINSYPDSLDTCYDLYKFKHIFQMFIPFHWFNYPFLGVRF